MKRRPAVLYIAYDGILEPLGQSQVLQYLRHLAVGYRIALLSYEKAEDWRDEGRRSAILSIVREAGIEWVPLRYHKRPTAPATAYDLAQGFVAASYLIQRYGIQIVHTRSYVPAALGLALKRLFGVRFLFDMRGFWADERVEAGIWPRGSPLYRLAKWFERQFLLEADAIVSLTHAGAAVLRELPYLRGRSPRLVVIPTCTDLERFQPAPPHRLDRDKDDFTLGYVGSASLWYLFDPVLEAFTALRATRPAARLLIVNRGQHDYIRGRLAEHRVPEAAVELKAVEFAAVPDEMRRMDAAVFFIRPTFSKLASAPTKLGEFLGCGIPCLTNSGVGDVDRILEAERVGVVVSVLDSLQLRSGVQRLAALAGEPAIGERCRAVALRHFDLGSGIAAYARLYDALVGGSPAARELTVPSGASPESPAASALLAEDGRG